MSNKLKLAAQKHTFEMQRAALQRMYNAGLEAGADPPEDLPCVESQTAPPLDCHHEGEGQGHRLFHPERIHASPVCQTQVVGCTP